MSDLRSARVPAVGSEDHIRGPEDGLLLIEYADLECPHCALLHSRLQELDAEPGQTQVRLVFRHFPSRSRHPRAWQAACAVEAAGLQGRFWEMHDLLFEDQGRLEDPHLWDRAQRLDLELARFDRDRRSDPVVDRVKRDFQSGIRAGVASTPTVFHDGTAYAEDAIAELLSSLAGRALG